jgi:hypothetical protein
MSVKRHGCYGSTIACNSKGCPWKITTGQVTKKAIRAYAESIGWGRRREHDLCAECFEPAKKAAAERIARRDARRKMTHEQRREDRNEQRRDRRAAYRIATKEAT